MGLIFSAFYLLSSCFFGGFIWKNIRKTLKNADVFLNKILTIFSDHSIIRKKLRKTTKNAEVFLNKEAEAMKTRAECLEKYGSDYFIEKK